VERLLPAAHAGQLLLPPSGDASEHAWHLFVVRLGPEAGASTDRAIDAELPGVAALPADLRSVASLRARAIADLASSGIGASVHFIPLHLHPLYREIGYRSGQFPGAERAYAGAISLPIWPGMTSEQVDRVADGLLAAIGLRA
jgi:dTDP-4-amino-4,6-dideoxygalactose transaminase